jgi:uncharacterized protein YndB with AHSA1/START domain
METTITVQTTVAATVHKVWTYWTMAEHIVNWNFASDDWHCPGAENDLCPGGKFRATMAANSGEMSFDFEGIYDEIIPLQKISYSMSDGRKVSVEFKEIGADTQVIETFNPEQMMPVDMQREGWQAILQNFKSYVEKN